MSTVRRDLLVRIQGESQEKWSLSKVFEEDVTKGTEDKKKFLATFPYPYCNGYLHVGHAFTISKAEFAVSYKRLKGFKCLYPFGFHCTGMPIQACANKLKREFEQYGVPPVFPVEEAPTPAPAATNSSNGDKSKNKKGKVASKASAKKYQWEILRESGITEELCRTFADPLAWLNYFPTENANDLKDFGLKSDWRRSFITTDVNPYYDAFIRWQFNKLRALQKVKFGKRAAVYSPMDGQPCADHDRASGEQVQPQEYTLIKMKLLRLPDTEAGKALAGRNVFLPAATLRPETMYGQTNCWVLPTGEYIAFELASGEVFIASQHSAQNMAFQDMFKTYGKFDVLGSFLGSDLIGLPVASPLAKYPEIFVLPLLTVSMFKGTGIVTSVPSDAPDDYRGIMDLKEKPALREKFGVRDEWIMNFEPVPIIDTPEFGNVAAKVACERYKIKSQNEKEKLALAKAEVYKLGFYTGTMLVGSMAGKAVTLAKDVIRQQMIADKTACPYFEPESQVMSRSGDECVVALCDQWYLEYGEPKWRAKVEECLADMDLYAEETLSAFQSVVAWLKEWACSRQFGLGSKLPWDKSWLIESLSDSTIYMAYYTVAQFLQGGLDNLNGDKVGPAGIRAEDMTDAVWDYIMLGTGSQTDSELSHIDSSVLASMRREFMYWYPVDLRVSGKDLIGNHLTFYLYNHVAMFGKEHWPEGIRVNGHVLLNAEKMSKSTGNFLTLRQAVSKFGADAVRFALADAGDTVEDANFSLKTADDAVLKLWVLVDFVKEGLAAMSSMRSGPIVDFADRVFMEQMKKHILAADAAYDKMLFRDALKSSFFEIVNDLGKYREAVEADKSTNISNMHRDVFLSYVHYQTIIISPICPHTCEHVWAVARESLSGRSDIALPELIVSVDWPTVEAPNQGILDSANYLSDTLSRIRAFLAKSQKRRGGKKGGSGPPPERPDTVTIFVCEEPRDWQKVVTNVLTDLFDADAWTPNGEWKFASDAPKKVAAALPADQKKNKKVMPYVAALRKDIEARGAVAFDRSLSFDETKVLNDNIEFVVSQLAMFEIKTVTVSNVASAGDSASVRDAVPGEPAFQCSKS